MLFQWAIITYSKYGAIFSFMRDQKGMGLKKALKYKLTIDKRMLNIVIEK